MPRRSGTWIFKSVVVTASAVYLQINNKQHRHYNVWFAYELQRRLDGNGVTSNALCPGFVPESIAERRRSPLARWMYRNLLARMPFARSLDQASESYLVAATDPHYETVGGVFIVDGKECRSSEESYDEQKARLLWERSAAWCGL